MIALNINMAIVMMNLLVKHNNTEIATEIFNLLFFVVNVYLHEFIYLIITYLINIFSSPYLIDSKIRTTTKNSRTDSFITVIIVILNTD